MNFPPICMSKIQENIIGYSTLIPTPFGEKCIIYADHTATGRPFKMIEDIIQNKIKPMIANSHTESSHLGHFSTQLLHYAEVSILKSFKVSKQTHFAIPTGNGATGAFERLTKILRITELRESSIRNLQNQNQNQFNIPCVYISPYEHHSNILPWQVSGCNLHKISGDKHGNMNLNSLEQQLFENRDYFIQIVSVSATSNVTSQRTDLLKMNKIIKSFRQTQQRPQHKVIFIVDCAAFCSHNRLDLSQNGLSEIDFVCISPHKHLGGSEATGLLIAKLSAYDSDKPPSFPGGGTVKAVISLEKKHTWYDSDPTSREMPGTQNAIGFYRAALTFELQDNITIEYIISREQENAEYFYQYIQMNNEILEKLTPPRRVQIYGDNDIHKRYDVFSFNIYGPGGSTDTKGKSMFHPNYVARVLNDVFGIQVRSGCSCAGPYGVQLLDITESRAEQIAEDVLAGYEDLKPGWVRLDTFFSFEQGDLDYIIEALYLIARYGEKMQRFYEVNQQTGQFNFKGQSYQTVDFSLFGIQKEPVKEITHQQRFTYLTAQMEQARSLLESPDRIIQTDFPNLIGNKFN